MSEQAHPLPARVHGVVAVVAIERAEDAHPLADALVAGGITTIEVTLRTAAALGAIAALSGRSDILVGAGTVLSRSEVDLVSGAGARFTVSPGFNQDMVERSLDLGMLPIPGVATATELMHAQAAGLSQVKLFPFRELGGLAVVDALSGPFPRMRFMPSGGVRLDDAPTVLAHRLIFAVGGSWMVPRTALVNQDWEVVQRLSETTTARLQECSP